VLSDHEQHTVLSGMSPSQRFGALAETIGDCPQVPTPLAGGQPRPRPVIEGSARRREHRVEMTRVPPIHRR
jgi:hypothetical protein